MFYSRAALINDIKYLRRICCDQSHINSEITHKLHTTHAIFYIYYAIYRTGLECMYLNLLTKTTKLIWTSQFINFLQISHTSSSSVLFDFKLMPNFLNKLSKSMINPRQTGIKCNREVD